jgi:hypothetical protein
MNKFIQIQINCKGQISLDILPVASCCTTPETVHFSTSRKQSNHAYQFLGECN